MSEIFQAIVKRSSIFLVVIGGVILLIGASGDIKLGAFALRLSSTTFQWVIIVTGLILVIPGILLEIKGNISGLRHESNEHKLFMAESDPFGNAKIEQQIANAKSIELLGYNLKSLLQEIREPITKAVIRGAYVRIVFVDFLHKPTQELFKQHTRRSDLMLVDWIDSFQYVQDIKDKLAVAPKVNGKFEVKLTTWIPSSRLILFDSGNENGLVKIGIHTVVFRQSLSGRLGFLLTRKGNPKAFEFFANGFRTLWESDSVEWDGKIPTIKKAG